MFQCASTDLIREDHLMKLIDGMKHDGWIFDTLHDGSWIGMRLGDEIREYTYIEDREI